MFDIVLVLLAIAILAGIILASLRIAYEAGVDAGWRQSGAWWDYIIKRDPQSFLEHIAAHTRGDVE
jgi:hypothetical protein